ncbi:MAG: methyltransferase domain-containing protein [Planctomycetes bacterium]|nr:methyltransferase domain-containing protein [Planctomycetota bacterium]
MTEKRCPVCRDADLSVFFAMDRVPVLANRLATSLAEARDAPRGDIRLGFCRSCGMIGNVAFDPASLAYTPSYENALDFSPLFRAYARDLAERLIATYDLRAKTIVDIGCGRGEFLMGLCEAGGNRGFGFDPGYDGPREVARGRGRIEFVRGLYDDARAAIPADFIACRHVLEHIPDPRAFLAPVLRAARIRTGAAIFFEVPDAMFTLRDLGIWDIIYEHCSYFTAPSLERLFREAGFVPRAIASAFGGQFLTIEAAPGEGIRAEDPRRAAGDIEKLVDRFAAAFRREVDRWRSRLARARDEGRRIALWGAGSKGVSFLNAIPEAEAIVAVVDINPRKRGAYVAGTGHRIVAPEDLVRRPPDGVLVMNPNYEGEIRDAVARLGIPSETWVVAPERVEGVER